MTETQVPRPLSPGKPVSPERLKEITPEIVRLYSDGASLRSLAGTFGINKATVRKVLHRHGLNTRNRAEAGRVRRAVKPHVAENVEDRVRWEALNEFETEVVMSYLKFRNQFRPALLYRISVERVSSIVDKADCRIRSVAEEVAADFGHLPQCKGAKKHGLSKNREYLSACAREYRKRHYATYREIDSRRKKHVNRMPTWANKHKIRFLYEMASDLGLTVDHIIPLQGEHICGLHVENNLQLLSHVKNCAKTNVFRPGPDPMIGPPRRFR